MLDCHSWRFFALGNTLRFCKSVQPVIICGMQEAAISIEPHERLTMSIWPWVIGAIALILLFVSVRSNLHQIPRSLSRQANIATQSAGAADIDIVVDGRDLAMSGTLGSDIDRDKLVSTIRDIDGVRIVVDDMQEFDPQQQENIERLAFKEGLDSINYSAVAFERGSASLTVSSQAALFELVEVLRAYPQFRIRVSGHTDNTGRAEVNLRISRERASSVANFLMDNNISANRIIAQGYGATRPIADNSTEAGRAANRRIEVNYVN